MHIKLKYMRTVHELDKEMYVSPETEVIEIGFQDWLLDYGGGNPETPGGTGDPNDPGIPWN